MVLAIFQIFQLATESSQETYYHPPPCACSHPFLFSMVLFLVAGPARPPDVPGIVNSFQYCRIFFERQVDDGPCPRFHRIVAILSPRCTSLKIYQSSDLFSSVSNLDLSPSFLLRTPSFLILKTRGRILVVATLKRVRTSKSRDDIQGNRR